VDTPTTQRSPEQASAIIRRQRVLIIIVSIALVVAVAGAIAARFVKSPAQQAAEQSPPPPSVITAPVVEQVLTKSVTVRGTVDVTTTVDVASRVAVSPAIVTRLPVAAGDVVGAGQVVAEISGRPVFAMAGTVPAYRPLGSGDTGTDVDQLQQNLVDLGFLGSASGTFDYATQTAVGHLFKNAGYKAPDSGLEFGVIVFVPSLPATVGSVTARAGDDAGTSPLLSLRCGAPVVRAVVPAGQESGIVAGLPVAVSDEVNRRSGTGVVESVGAFTGQQTDANGLPAGQAGFPVTITVGDGIDGSWVGASVAVTITISSTPSAVLTVPIAAIQTDANGATYVDVVDGDVTRAVLVTTGVTADGYVEVTPASGSLRPGDKVVVQ